MRPLKHHHASIAFETISLEIEKARKTSLFQAMLNLKKLTAFRRCVFGRQGISSYRTASQTTTSGSLSSLRSASPINRTLCRASRSSTVHVWREDQRVAIQARGNTIAAISRNRYGDSPRRGSIHCVICDVLGRLCASSGRIDRSSSGIQTSDRIRLEGFRQSALGRAGSNHGFRHLGTHRVVLVSRQSHSSQDTDDRHNDHQFDQGETLLNTLHGKSPLRGLKMALMQQPSCQFSHSLGPTLVFNKNY